MTNKFKSPPHKLAGLLLFGFLAVFGLQEAKGQVNFWLDEGKKSETVQLAPGPHEVTICLRCSNYGPSNSCAVYFGPTSDIVQYKTDTEECDADVQSNCYTFCLNVEEGEDRIKFFLSGCFLSAATVTITEREVECPPDGGGDPGGGGDPPGGGD